MTDEKRLTIEDTGGEFGFRVRWRVQDHWADVEVFEIVGVDDEGPLLLLKDWEHSEQHVRNPDEAEPYLTGFIKWDGCSEFDMKGVHWEGPRDYKRHIALVEYLYRRAFQLMGCEPYEPWDAAKE